MLFPMLCQEKGASVLLLIEDCIGMQLTYVVHIPFDQIDFVMCQGAEKRCVAAAVHGPKNADQQWSRTEIWKAPASAYSTRVHGDSSGRDQDTSVRNKSITAQFSRGKNIFKIRTFDFNSGYGAVVLKIPVKVPKTPMKPELWPLH